MISISRSSVFVFCFSGFCVLFLFRLVLVTHWIINLFAQLCGTKSQHEDETLTLGCLQEVPTIIIVHFQILELWIIFSKEAGSVQEMVAQRRLNAFFEVL